MSDRKDYYKILGITDEEKKIQGEEFNSLVKKKYKKLAIQFHPDRQNSKSEKEKADAEEKFKEINEAKEVLITKRAEYDNPQSNFKFEGFGDSNPFSFDFGDIFSHFGFGGSSRQQNVVKKGQSMRIQVKMTLGEIFSGVDKTIKYKRFDRCPTCNGSGKQANTTVEKCSHCHGTGQILTVNGPFQTITTCPHCGGSGKIMKNPCHTCGGNGIVETENETEFNIPKGIGEGYQFVLKGLGHAPKNCEGEYGDLIVLIRELPHNKFQRDDNDLYFELHINVVDAILGCVKEIETIDGKKLSTRIQNGVQDGSKIRFSGKGLPIYAHEGRYGDMFAIIKIDVPKSVTTEERQLLEQLKTKPNFR